MKHSEVLHILLMDALLFEKNSRFVKEHLKAAVNNALDNLEWYDGYDIAVKGGELENEEYQELLGVIKDAYPEVRVDKEHLVTTLEESLPYFHSVPGASWLVGDDFVIFADLCSVGKLQGERFVWVVSDISIDGVELLELTENSVKGLYWDGLDPDSYGLNQEFELNLENGSFIKGNASKRIYALTSENAPKKVKEDPDWSVFEEKKPWWKFW